MISNREILQSRDLLKSRKCTISHRDYRLHVMMRRLVLCLLVVDHALVASAASSAASLPEQNGVLLLTDASSFTLALSTYSPLFLLVDSTARLCIHWCFLLNHCSFCWLYRLAAAAGRSSVSSQTQPPRSARLHRRRCRIFASQQSVQQMSRAWWRCQSRACRLSCSSTAHWGKSPSRTKRSWVVMAVSPSTLAVGRALRSSAI